MFPFNKNIIGYCIALVICCQLSFTVSRDKRYFELRVYTANGLQRDHVAQSAGNKLSDVFRKHKVEVIGYWVPEDTAVNELYQVVAYRNKRAYDRKITALDNDPLWNTLAVSSGTDAQMVTRKKLIVMNAADISPAISTLTANPTGSVELRIYHCFPGKLEDLLTRFRNHTKVLFEKHDMQNLAYWTSVESGERQPDLVYLLGYPSKEAGVKSWLEFRKDPEWVNVKANSEKNGLIVDSVTSVFLKPLNLFEK